MSKEPLKIPSGLIWVTYQGTEPLSIC
uniref:Uncharacterized protein n=1 Tax=Lepeophtheirus salmonis TaxID=72036 RepID=A0A0K2SW09_LEPSM